MQVNCMHELSRLLQCVRQDLLAPDSKCDVDGAWEMEGRLFLNSDTNVGFPSYSPGVPENVFDFVLDLARGSREWKQVHDPMEVEQVDYIYQDELQRGGGERTKDVRRKTVFTNDRFPTEYIHKFANADLGNVNMELTHEGSSVGVMRFSLAMEEKMSDEDIKRIEISAHTGGVRLKQRCSFVYNESYRLDMTRVFSGKSLEEARRQPPVYEIEMELLNNVRYWKQKTDNAQLAFSYMTRLSGLYLQMFANKSIPIKCRLQNPRYLLAVRFPYLHRERETLELYAKNTQRGDIMIQSVVVSEFFIRQVKPFLDDQAERNILECVYSSQYGTFIVVRKAINQYTHHTLEQVMDLMERQIAQERKYV